MDEGGCSKLTCGGATKRKLTGAGSQRCAEVSSLNEHAVSGRSSTKPLAHVNEHEPPEGNVEPQFPPTPALDGAVSAQGKERHTAPALVHAPSSHVADALRMMKPAAQVKLHEAPDACTSLVEQLSKRTLAASGNKEFAEQGASSVGSGVSEPLLHCKVNDPFLILQSG
jgi:hypothetical protein